MHDSISDASRRNSSCQSTDDARPGRSAGPLPDVFPEPRITQSRFGDLDCIVVDGGPTATIPVIVCHGYGAPGHDLAGLSLEWLRMLDEVGGHFRFVFPAAPISLADQGMPDGRAWWPLNMARLLDMAGASRFDELHDEEPPGLDTARAILTAAIDQVLAGMNRPSTWALGGFSQGAMLSLDTVLRGGLPTPSVLFQFSGTLVCRTIWETKLDRLKEARVLQSHGRVDPILPFDSAVRLETLLCGAGVDVHFHPFDGPHTIDPETVRLSGDALRTLVAPSRADEPSPSDASSGIQSAGGQSSEHRNS